jgi:RimJ/RimL family protein N-acetyltransferase
MLQTDSIAPRVSFSEDEFVSLCGDFDVVGFHDRDRAVGFAFLKGGEPHIAILPEYWGRCGGAILEALKMFHAKHKRLVAKVHHKNHRAIRFVEKLGFSEIPPDGDMRVFERIKDE